LAEWMPLKERCSRLLPRVAIEALRRSATPPIMFALRFGLGHK